MVVMMRISNNLLKDVYISTEEVNNLLLTDNPKK